MIDDFIHDGEIYDYVNDFDGDFEFYKKWCVKASGACLELCCGTGRLTIPLVKAGIDITGVDYSVSMLKKAREKALTQKVDLPFIRQDIRKLNLLRLNKKFSFIFIPFNSLQCIYKLEDLEKIFKCVKAHMQKKSLFMIEVFNPDIKLMVERSTGWKKVSDFKTVDGRKVSISEQCRYDCANEVNRVNWKHAIDGKETIVRLDMRCFWPLEMDAILKYNGFKIIHKFGGFDESEFDCNSKKQIYVLKIKG